jgi:hypothetical protein
MPHILAFSAIPRNPNLDPLDLLFARATARHIHELIVAGRPIVRDHDRAASLAAFGLAVLFNFLGELAPPLRHLDKQSLVVGVR